MTNMNLKDALDRALRTTKQYVDNSIQESAFKSHTIKTSNICYDTQ